MLGLILMCLALVFAIFAACGWPPVPRVNVGWLAFALFVAAHLVR